MSENKEGSDSEKPSSGAQGKETSPYKKGNNKKNRNGRYNNKSSKSNMSQRTLNGFKGATSGLNGNVFQTHSENPKPNQFQRTIEEFLVYSSKEYKDVADHLTVLFTELKTPMPTKPTALDDKASDIDKEGLKEDIKYWRKEERHLKNTLRSIFNVIWGQCSPLMQNKLEGIETYEVMKGDGDAASLLKAIKGISYDFESGRSPHESIDETHRKLYVLTQGPLETNAEFLKKFKSLVDVLIYYGGVIGSDPGVIAYERKLEKADASIVKPRSDEDMLLYSKNKMIATMFLRRADKTRYWPLIKDLRMRYAEGEDRYPCTLEQAYARLQTYEPIHKRERAMRASQKNQNTRDDTSSPNGTNYRKLALQYVQDTEAVKGTNGKLYSNIKCFKCNLMGHYSDKCPNSSDDDNQDGQVSGTQAMMEAVEFDHDNDEFEDLAPNYTFVQAIEQTYSQSSSLPDKFSPFHILLDTGSSCSVFKTKSLLRNIHRGKGSIRAFTNGGYQDSFDRGTLPGFFDVWYNPDSMLNILSFAEVAAHFRIVTDTARSDSIFVYLSDAAKPIEFKMLRNGLYFFDAKNGLASVTAKNAITFYPYNFAQIVSENKKNFTRREIQGADDAKELYKSIGMPSYAKFFSLLQSNFFRNCPVTLGDAKRCIKIYGKEIAAMKGKMTRPQPQHIPSHEPTAIPKCIYDGHKNITLCIDFFFVQGLAFFHSISRSYKFRTTEYVLGRGKKIIEDCIDRIIHTYQARELSIVDIHGDGEFKCLETLYPNINITIAPPEHHIGDIERSVRTQKERTRCNLHGLPYKRYPRAMVEGCVNSATMKINDLPADDGVSEVLSPAMLIVDRPAPDYNYVTSLQFGDYVQVYEKTKNNMNTRTIGAIALHPSSNKKTASWFFMSLVTGNKIHRGYCHPPVPISDDVIARVHEIALEQEMPELDGDNFHFSWNRDGNNIDFENDEINNDDDENEENPPPPILNEEAGAHTDDATDNVGGAFLNDDTLDIDEDTGAPIDDVEEAGAHEAEADEEGGAENVIINDNNDEYNDGDSTPDIDASSNDDDLSYDDVKEEHDIDANPTAPPMTTTRAGRNVTRHDYSALNKQGMQFTQDAEKSVPSKDMPKVDKDPPAANGPKAAPKIITSGKKLRRKPKKAKPMKPLKIKDTLKHMVGIIMNQMSAKKGIRKHGKVAIEAIFKEYAQLDDLDVFRSIAASSLTKEQKNEALRLITVIKEKRCGKIKGRACADGRPQRKYIPKEDATAPTVSLEGLILSILIDAKEGNDVATADVAGAFLKGLMDAFVLIKLKDEEVDILCDVNEKYKENVIYENGHKVLYLQLHKALYGTMRAAIIWYETFTETLENLGFALNPYDPCVANKMVNGTMLTICWYVDDTKMSHKDSKVVDWLIEELEKQHGKMTVTRGPRHTYVGMDINFVGNGKVEIMTKDYITECIESFGEDLGNIKVKTPATKDLFMIEKDEQKLDNKQHDIFHHIVAKLLYVTRRSRLDIGLAIAYLCTRVGCSTKGDWEKLRRCLNYLENTIDMPRILSATSFDMMRTWVDAAFAVHDNMRSHTGGVISFDGVGVINPKSSKQRINTKSSTEAELVGASDYLPWVVWVSNFMRCQGYNIKSNIFYQDNQSAIRMEKNGTASTSERSRHINIRYFFIKDVIIREGIDIKYCPTEEMIADFYTKALQGKLYRNMRDYIMGHSSIFGEERVEICESKEGAPKPKEPKKNVSSRIDEMTPRSDEILTGSGDNKNDYPKGINVKNDITPDDFKPQINDETKIKLTYAQIVMKREDSSQDDRIREELDVK